MIFKEWPKSSKELCGQFGVDLVEGHAMVDHIHMCLSIPPKLSVAYTVGWFRQCGLAHFGNLIWPTLFHNMAKMPVCVSHNKIMGRLKGKSAVRIHRDYIQGRGNAKGFTFWSTGYCVSTVGLDEAKVRAYIRNQEQKERRQEQLGLDI